MRRPPARDERDLDVVVIGEINPDIIVSDPDPVPRFGQHERLVESVTLAVGSSSVIFAVGAARLGLRVAMVGVVGDDPFGRYMVDAMRENDIDVSGCRIDPTRPTGATVILANQSDRAILTAPGTMSELRGSDVPAELIAAARHVHVGSFFIQSGLQPDVPALFQAAHRQGATTSIDPNADPDGRWDSGLNAGLAEADIFFPNATEACAIARAGDPVSAGARLADGNPGLVVAVKLGNEGALAAVTTGVVARTAAFPVESVDAIGAGDSFDAGFIAGWLDGESIETCLRLGAVCGALSTRGIGGTSAQPTRADADSAVVAWT